MTDAVAAEDLDAATFGRIATALACAESAHLPAVLDVTALGERRELHVTEPGGPTLGALMSRRRTIAPGEAATVVVSAARALAALHAAGYCGVALADDDVRFDTDGRPVLIGFHELRETIQIGSSGRADDWRGLAALAERLGLIASHRGPGAFGTQQAGLGLALAALAASESTEHLAQLEDAVFDVAEPAAVRLDAAVPTAVSSRPRAVQSAAGRPRTHLARAVQVGHPEPATASAGEPAPAEMRRRAAHRRPSASALIEAFDAGPAALLSGPRERLRTAAKNLGTRVRGRTRVRAIGAGATIALILAMLVLLPSRPHVAPGARTIGATPGASAVAQSPRSAATPAVSGAGGGAAPLQIDAHAPNDADARLRGDDPVAAASVLLTRRDACLDEAADARANCLAPLADSGTARLDEPDRALAGLTPSLLERSGDSALIALTPTSPKTAPASALVMRTEAGWRLRQLYDN